MRLGAWLLSTRHVAGRAELGAGGKWEDPAPGLDGTAHDKFPDSHLRAGEGGQGGRSWACHCESLCPYLQKGGKNTCLVGAWVSLITDNQHLILGGHS